MDSSQLSILARDFYPGLSGFAEEFAWDLCRSVKIRAIVSDRSGRGAGDMLSSDALDPL